MPAKDAISIYICFMSKVVVIIFAALIVCLSGSSQAMAAEGRIVGGTIANQEDWPFFVSISTFPKSDNLFTKHPYCGGVLVAPRWVLTAAACIDGAERKIYSIFNRPDLLSDKGFAVPSQAMYVPKQYTADMLSMDAGLIKLARAVGSETVALASTNAVAGQYATIAGVGTNANGAPSRWLREAQVKILPNSACYEAYDNEFVASTMLCAAASGKDACWDDFGGPLIVAGKLQGIISWGRGCADPGFPGVYTRVDAVKSWVDGITTGLVPQQGEIKGFFISKTINKGKMYVIGSAYLTQTIRRGSISFDTTLCRKGTCYDAGHKFAIRGALGASTRPLLLLNRKKRCFTGTVNAVFAEGEGTDRKTLQDTFCNY